jgi:hypothetical protein
MWVFVILSTVLFCVFEIFHNKNNKCAKEKKKTQNPATVEVFKQELCQCLLSTVSKHRPHREWGVWLRWPRNQKKMVWALALVLTVVEWPSWRGCCHSCELFICEQLICEMGHYELRKAVCGCDQGALNCTQEGEDLGWPYMSPWNLQGQVDYKVTRGYGGVLKWFLKMTSSRTTNAFCAFKCTQIYHWALKSGWVDTVTQSLAFIHYVITLSFFWLLKMSNDSSLCLLGLSWGIPEISYTKYLACTLAHGT